MKYIELFAGCGGLSLGLESLEFDLLFANELSPMASETFAYNFLDEDLQKLAREQKSPKRVKWISSRYAVDDLQRRLRENPNETPAIDSNSNNGDLGNSCRLKDIEGNLLVGSIKELNKLLESNSQLVRELRSRNVELVSGGAPCQSFSMAGLRQHDNIRNTLPLDFANFVSFIQPKIVLLENVSGILRAFTLRDGTKHYAWFEVARAFVGAGYYPLCLHVNAKNACAAQNRPRFILIALRADIFDFINDINTDECLGVALNETKNFFAKALSDKTPMPFTDLNYYDIEKDKVLFNSYFLKSLNQCDSSKKWHTVKQAIDDLRGSGRKARKSNYVRLLESVFPENQFHNNSRIKLPNNEHRRNGIKVRMRFRLYQLLAGAKVTHGGKWEFVSKEVLKYLRQPASDVLSTKTVGYLLDNKFLSDDGESFVVFKNKMQLEHYLANLATKKQTQRALIASDPAPATLSIPDDACHYGRDVLRTLSVREIARIQSFPDWFEFRSKVTTGGKMRSFEVPQYTQVGNAVPPLLGRALGQVVVRLLDTK